MNTARSFNIREASQVGEARRYAATFAKEQGLTEDEIGRLALIVTELGTNLIKHTVGTGGELLIQGIHGPGGGVEILSLDRGPGMANVSQAMRDGYSTTGTAGAGLGGVGRLSRHFEVFSRPGLGTAILAQIGGSADTGNARRLDIGAVCLPVHGEDCSGDQWDARVGESEVTFLVSDGLGHGSSANAASVEAVRIFESDRNGAGAGLERLFDSLHGALRKTRGAAISAAIISGDAIRFMGIGNVSGAVLTPGRTTHMVSLAGIVGHELRKRQEFRYSFPKCALLVMHSDGLGTKWDIEQYPGLWNRHPSLIAGVLYRDFSRERDDVTVVVARERAA